MNNDQFMDKMRSVARESSGYLDLHNMTGSEEMKKKAIAKLEEILNDPRLEKIMDDEAWASWDEGQRSQDDYLIDP